MSRAKGLFWFRRDLRLEDNIGLKKARDQVDHLYAVFIVDPHHADWSHSCGDRFAFKMKAVEELREKIRSAGGELYLRRGEQATELSRLQRRLGVDYLFYNNCYEPYERRRDRAVNSKLQSAGVKIKTYKDQVFHEKKEILTGKKTPYRVFGYYKKKWKSEGKEQPAPTVQKFEKDPAVEAGEIPTAETVGLERRLDSTGEDLHREASLLLDEFLEGGLLTYHKTRDYPARRGTSRLSAYLRFGILSPRKIYYAAREARENNPDLEGPETFIEELIWRDFYHQLLFNFPEVAENNLKTKYDSLNWEENSQWLAAWKEGRTGYPLVDAAMRQLNRTGWMHNRLRMISAMFLTKDLFIHWKEGEKYFMNCLLDGDTAANNGGWQWSASTGADAAPYFRIFNPVTQSEKYDPEGEFIRNYCPELAGLDSETIHAPFAATEEELASAGVKLGENYPRPIVDHSRRRAVAQERFEQLQD